MIKTLLPLIAAVAVVLVLLGPARPYLPSALRLQSGGALVTDADEPIMDHGRVTGVGLAPAPVVNPPATAARIAVTTQPFAEAEKGYALAARVTAADGSAFADAPVRFYEIVDLFGQREMFIGTATTDGRGTASLLYLPSQIGVHQIVVRTSARAKVTAGEGRTSFEASVAAPQPRTERSPLSSFSDKVPYAVGIVLLAVWGLIAFALIGTARGVIGGARGQEKGDTA